MPKPKRRVKCEHKWKRLGCATEWCRNCGCIRILSGNMQRLLKNGNLRDYYYPKNRKGKK